MNGTSLRVAATVAAWLLLCGVGASALLRYQRAAGAPAAAPEKWPGRARLEKGSGPTLVMFAHPRCPCSAAAVDSLSWLMSRAGGTLRAYVVFYAPSALSPDWERTSLRSAAEEIPGVAVVSDKDGAEARRFGAKTSGQTLIYGADGKLIYSGGLTSGRGHRGPNRWRRAALGLVSGNSAAPEAGPVFGCSLLRATAEREG